MIVCVFEPSARICWRAVLVLLSLGTAPGLTANARVPLTTIRVIVSSSLRCVRILVVVSAASSGRRPDPRARSKGRS